MSTSSKRTFDVLESSTGDSALQGRLVPSGSTTVEPWKTVRSDCSSLSWDSDLSPPPPLPMELPRDPEQHLQQQHQEKRPKRRGRISTRPQPPFVCFCGKQFKRHEHMSRHKATHSDDLKYECPICGKGFRRQDVMHRHTQTHSRTNSNHAPRRKAAKVLTDQTHRQTAALSRADRACVPCKRAKLRCDGQFPCSRCVCHPNKDCHYQHGHALTSASASPSGSSLSSALQSSPADYDQPLLLPPPMSHSGYPHLYHDNGSMTRYMSEDASMPSASTSMPAPAFAPIPSWAFAGFCDPERGFTREHERAASVPQHPSGPDAFDRCYVPTQPYGALDGNSGGLGLTSNPPPSSLTWTARGSWDNSSSQHNEHTYSSSHGVDGHGGLVSMSMGHSGRGAFEQQHQHWNTLSETAAVSEAGTLSASDRSCSTSPFFVGGRASPPPPPPPPAYLSMCQGDVKSEAPYSSLHSSADTPFYHFSSAVAAPTPFSSASFTA